MGRRFAIAYAILMILAFAAGGALGRETDMTINRVTISCTPELRTSNSLAIGVAYNHAGLGLLLAEKKIMPLKNAYYSIAAFKYLTERYNGCLTEKAKAGVPGALHQLIVRYQNDSPTQSQ